MTVDLQTSREFTDNLFKLTRIKTFVFDTLLKVTNEPLLFNYSHYRSIVIRLTASLKLLKCIFHMFYFHYRHQ